MAEAGNRRTGGRLLVDQLLVHGVDTVFCVPGESYLAALDAFWDVGERIKLVTCRHEVGAANMAEAYGKLTGKPGVVFVTRGPGACHASIGLHTALQDSTPLVCFIGQVAREMTDREAFQEMDYRKFYSEVTKWTGQIEQVDRIPEMVSHAFHLAAGGRPGPVALSLPEDMLTELSAVGDAGAYKRVAAHPGAAQMEELRELLAKAKRPLMMLGGGGWTPAAAADIARFAAASAIPVTTSFRNQDRIDNRHPCHAGTVGIGSPAALIERVKAADLLLLVGPRLGEQTSQSYTLVDIPRPKQTVVHVHPGAEELGRVFQADLPIVAGMPEFAAAAAALAPVDSAAWAADTKKLHADYLAGLEVQPTLGALDMAHVMRVLQKTLPKDAIVANDAGNFSGWAHRYLPFSVFPSQLGPTNGAMGYGVPAAIAAAIQHPERMVIGFAGDGGFMMTAQEIATAMQVGAKPILFVINNGMYGTIRMHQEREHPTRYPGTDLVNPDFALFARSFGAHGETVTKDAEFEGAWERARAAGKLAVIELRTDPEAITSRTTLTKIRENAIAQGKGPR